MDGDGQGKDAAHLDFRRRPRPTQQNNYDGDAQITALTFLLY